ncbi:hypothetical protein [Thalassovita sp.]|jgi:hypothetical protein|uniref:hypothetical protein n=1 Tax=Thalassovita sp. TaxID=1979401 RepID=UPI002AAFC175|nr:hypothetical protein [Thalassovita sp.]
MAKITPLWVSEKTAAAMLDMSRTEFSKHVNSGSLPPAQLRRNGIIRWSVAALEKIADGSAALPDQAEDIEL